MLREALSWLEVGFMVGQTVIIALQGRLIRRQAALLRQMARRQVVRVVLGLRGVEGGKP